MTTTLKSKIRAISPRSLAVKLYGILGIAVAAIVALAYAGSHVAHITANAAIHLSHQGIDGIVKATELEVLFEQHRRLVEAAPAEIDKGQILRSREALERIQARIADLSHEKTDAAARAVTAELPKLKTLAAQVFFLTQNLALDSAADAVDAYQIAATRMQESIRNIRKHQQSAAETMVHKLISNASTLVLWGTFAASIAMIVLAPVGLLVLGNAARRMRALWSMMHHLARNDIHRPVPSLQDFDEIGDMARAVQIFKENAIALAGKRGEVEQINRFLDIALNNMARGLSMFDADRRLVICNESYRAMYSLPKSMATRGTPWQDIERHRDAHLQQLSGDPPTDGHPLANLHDLSTLRTAHTAKQTLKDGRIIAVAVQPLDDGGWVAVHEDITRQHEAQAHITKLARHDTLTGLSNRMVFREEIENRLRKASSTFALLLIDLDRFKQVNDTYGHPTGDALLEAVAERLRKMTRASDVVARLGGDEFAILQDGVFSVEASTTLAARLIDNLSEPYVIDGHRLVIGASIGVARAPDDGTTASQMFGHADLALYQAKQQGRGTVALFDPKMKEAAIAERTLDQDLRRALVEQQFELHYQPILDLRTGKTECCEALLRWRHPQRGLVPPLDFIPYAETSRLIVPIGRWALKQACQDAADWPNHVRVAVNLSAVQVLSGQLLEDIADCLSETQLEPSRLELEVTESLLLNDEPATRETLLAVRQTGVHIALDDFGTGYASLSYLRRFPFDKLKIDQMFVRDIADQQTSTAIVRAVAALAKSLDIKAVAEGVETKAHLARVAAAGCTQVQGYLFSRPVPAAEIKSVIENCRIPDLSEDDWLTTVSKRQA